MFKYLIPSAGLWWLSGSHPAIAAALVAVAVLLAAAWVMRAFRGLVPIRPAAAPAPDRAPSRITYNILNVHNHPLSPPWHAPAGFSDHPVLDGEVL